MKPKELHKFAVELAAQSQPAVIVTSGNAATAAVKSVASEILIIFRVADTIEFALGLVSSLNRARRSYEQA